jgi:hypothetical protein
MTRPMASVHTPSGVPYDRRWKMPPAAVVWVRNRGQSSYGLRHLEMAGGAAVLAERAGIKCVPRRATPEATNPVRG